MGHTILFSLLFPGVSVISSSCKKAEVVQVDELNHLGLPGQWKQESITINGITNMSVPCCDYIEFKTDSEPNDLKGTFKATGVGYESNGVFEVSAAYDTIKFEFDGKLITYGFLVSGNLLTFTPTQNGDIHSEDWRKE